MRRKYKLVVVHKDIDDSLQSEDLAESISAHDAAKLINDCNLPNIVCFTLGVVE